MQDNHHALRSVLIIALFWGILAGITKTDEISLTNQTLQAIEDCISRTPSQWPDEWKQEYLETIRSAIELHRDASHYAVRLKILLKGFELYWEALKKNEDRPSFEVHLAQIRWYTEHLMGAKFPTEQERQTLRDQFTDIWNYAANSLVEQFPFLDPNAVQNAKQDELSECYRKIDAPLMPVYLLPFSEAQVEQIKQRWDNLRYARVDLLHRLGGNSTTLVDSRDAPLSNAKRDYELTKESLSQLLGLVWMVVPQRPEYYLSAIQNRNEVLKNRFQSKRMARGDQQRLEKERSRQLLQTEHISFMLAALLETMSYNDGSDSIRPLEQSLLEQQDKKEKGGDAYEVDNDSQKK